jgi:hypothetical protein
LKIWLIIGVAAIAATVTFGQWAVVIGGDDFTYYGPEGHKVFTYGFPFRIFECAPELPIYTPTWQIGYRFLGNFTVFFLSGICVVALVHRLRRTKRHHEDKVTRRVA